MVNRNNLEQRAPTEIFYLVSLNSSDTSDLEPVELGVSVLLLFYLVIYIVQLKDGLSWVF